jgi:hypothetical protein
MRQTYDPITGATLSADQKDRIQNAEAKQSDKHQKLQAAREEHGRRMLCVEMAIKAIGATTPNSSDDNVADIAQSIYDFINEPFARIGE